MSQKHNPHLDLHLILSFLGIQFQDNIKMEMEKVSGLAAHKRKTGLFLFYEKLYYKKLFTQIE